MNKKALICLLLSSTLLLAACAGDGTPADTTTSPTEDTTPVESSTAGGDSVDPNIVNIISDSASQYIIIRPEDAADNGVAAAVKLKAAIKEHIGVDLELKDDWVHSTDTEALTRPEIIVGNCAREEYVNIKDSIEERGFIISIVGNKLLICGKTEKLTLQAVEYFIENYLTDEYASRGSLALPIDLCDTQVAAKFEMAQLINSEDSYTTRQDKLFSIPSTDGYSIHQGGCTDGKYLYMAMVRKNTDCYIYKYDLTTYAEVARSAPLQLDHANDICYNPDTGMLVVVHNAPNRNKISFIDPETLTLVDSKIIKFEIFSIAYCQERQQYVIGLSYGQNYAILDSDFNRVKYCTVTSTGYTTQGMECDNDFIYFVQYKQNVIMIYDWSGKLVTRVDMTLTGLEPENISLVEDTFYIGCNNSSWNGGVVYALEIIKQ